MCVAYCVAACGGRTETGGVVYVEPDGGPSDASLGDVVAAPDASCDADLLTDPTNCAVCGHSCMGGACVGGNCQPVSIPTPNGALAIALSDTDVVFTTPTGELWRVPKSGGVAHMLAPALQISVSGNLFGLVTVGGLAFQAGLYSNAIRVVPLAGGPMRMLGAVEPTGLATDGKQVFIASAKAPLMSLQPFANGTNVMQTPVVDVIGLTSNATDIFACVSTGGQSTTLMRTPIFGGPSIDIGVDTCLQPSPLASDAEHVYALAGPIPATVTRTDIAAPNNVAALAKDAAYGGLAIDDKFIYYAQLQPCKTPCQKGLARVKKVFSLPTTLATSGDPIAIAVDATAIYFTTTTGIVRLAKP